MSTSFLRRFVVPVILLLILAACGSGSAEKATSTPAPTPTEEPTADLLVVDVPVFDPDGYYTFENPGGWTVSQLQLVTENGAVVINPLPSANGQGTFEDYIDQWTDHDLETVKTEDGETYAVDVIGGRRTVLLETSDGVRWGIQMSLADGSDTETNLDDYADDLLAIALSATYIYREAEAPEETKE